MFSKADNQFDDLAADPARRRAAITDLSRRRTILFWCAMGSFVVAIAEIWSGRGTAAILGASVLSAICFKMESDLRLLRIVERLQGDTDDKTNA